MHCLLGLEKCLHPLLTLYVTPNNVMYCLFTYHFFCITSEISYNLLSTFHHIQNVIYVLLEFDYVVKDVRAFMPFVLEKCSFVPVYNACPAIPPRVS